jgi:CheY-like chemotaxis protein
MHGGTVEVHSAGVGQGSEFLVRLPILAGTPEPPPSPLAPDPSPLIKGRRILIVDDNRDSAASLAMLLKLTGNETYTAFDGLEAVKAAAMFRPDMAVLDIGLPKLNGYEAARKIREQPEGKKMVLVALTGWGQDEDRRKSTEAGFDGHIVKPVDYITLMKLLAELQAAKE